MRRRRVFISHVAKDAPVANALKALITKQSRAKIQCFVSSDFDSIGLGHKWFDEIQDALQRCHFEVVLCTPESVHAPWILFEAGAVWMRGRPVIPLCYKGIDPGDLPFPLRFFHGRNLLGSKELLSLLGNLMKGLKIGISKEDIAAELKKLRKLSKSPTTVSPLRSRHPERPLLTIQSALLWAPTGKEEPITETVRQFVNNNELHISPCGRPFSDIEPNVHKFLTVEYSFGPHRNQVTKRDDEPLLIPSSADKQAVLRRNARPRPTHLRTLRQMAADA